jgi:hypothetical protein
VFTTADQSPSLSVFGLVAFGEDLSEPSTEPCVKMKQVEFRYFISSYWENGEAFVVITFV